MSEKESQLSSLGYLPSVLPSEKGGAGAGFAAPAEELVGLAKFSQATQKILDFPPSLPQTKVICCIMLCVLIKSGLLGSVDTYC